MTAFTTPAPWRIRGGRLDFTRTRIMGVVNVTPDSFSDGGRFLDPEDALRRAEILVREGADLLDIGGESTRPGSAPVPALEEIRRIHPVITEAVKLGVPVSVDTRKASVARKALEAGAAVINDISALDDPDMAGAVAEAEAGLVLMHMQGTPSTMQQNPSYEDVVGEVADFLTSRRDRAAAGGIHPEAVVLDPGIGFGKTLEHNLELLRRLSDLAVLGSPILVGVSRKQFIGTLSGVENPGERTAGSVAAALAARLRGASILRVHDVAATRNALRVFESILEGGERS